MQPERDLDVRWRPISLLFKNEPPEDSDYYGPSLFTHQILRVMMAVQAAADTPAAGNEAVYRLYWQSGTWIHQDGNTDFTAAELLEAVGIDTSHAAAFDDEQWDSVIREGMDEGLALTGNDVGTPIIAIERSDGELANRLWQALARRSGDDAIGSRTQNARLRSGGFVRGSAIAGPPICPSARRPRSSFRHMTLRSTVH